MSPANPITAFTVLGVEFRRGDSARSLPTTIQNRLDAILARISECAADTMHRQRRSKVTYVDAMTAVTFGEPAGLKNTELMGLLAQLVEEIGRSDPSDELILELGQLPVLAPLRQSFRREVPPSDRPLVLQGVKSLGELEIGSSGREGLGERAGARVVRQHLFFDIEDLELGAEDISADLLVAIALLAQIKCDIDVLLATDWLPVHRCERLRCGGFYPVKRMSGRSRFCSDTCRANAAREQ